MKKWLVLIAALSGGPAHAEWTKVIANDEMVLHIDLQTIRKDGSRRRFWVMQDLTERAVTGELSRRVQMEIDCNKETSRVLFVSGHSEPMAAGKVLQHSPSPGDLTPIPPATPAESLMKASCKT